jgi:hypothetical protein
MQQLLTIFERYDPSIRSAPPQGNQVYTWFDLPVRPSGHREAHPNAVPDTGAGRRFMPTALADGTRNLIVEGGIVQVPIEELSHAGNDIGKYLAAVHATLEPDDAGDEIRPIIPAVRAGLEAAGEETGLVVAELPITEFYEGLRGTTRPRPGEVTLVMLAVHNFRPQEGGADNFPETEEGQREINRQLGFTRLAEERASNSYTRTTLTARHYQVVAAIAPRAHFAAAPTDDVVRRASAPKPDSLRTSRREPEPEPASTWQIPPLMSTGGRTPPPDSSRASRRAPEPEPASTWGPPPLTSTLTSTWQIPPRDSLRESRRAPEPEPASTWESPPPLSIRGSPQPDSLRTSRREPEPEPASTWGRTPRDSLRTSRRAPEPEPALTTEQLQALTTEQIQALTTEQLRALTRGQIRALTTEQLRALTVRQLQELTRGQVQALTTEQLRALTREQRQVLIR